MFFLRRNQEVDLHKQDTLDETHLDAVRGLIELRGFHPSASTTGARRSDAATSDKDKQTWFNMEEFRLE